MRTALVLEGGAMRGIYTAGVIDVLLENNIEVDAVFGVSAGALFGVNYVSKQKGRVIRYTRKYIKNKNFLTIRSLIKTGDIMNKKFMFDDLVYKLDKFDFETFKKNKCKFYSVVTNVETGEAEYILIKDSDKQMEYLRASGSMPGFSRIVEIDGKKYLDGATADSIPLKKAHDMGYDRVIVVLTQPIDYVKKPINMKFFNMKYKKYPDYLKAIKDRHIMYNEELDYIKNEEQDGIIVVIRPSHRVKIGRIEKDIKVVNEMYELGINDCKNKIGEIKEFLGK